MEKWLVNEKKVCRKGVFLMETEMSDAEETPYPKRPEDIYLQREARNLSRSISVMCWFAVAAAIGSAVIMSVALSVATHMELKTRALLGTSFGALIIGMLFVLACSRRFPTTLNTFTGFLLFASGACLGVAIGVI